MAAVAVSGIIDIVAQDHRRKAAPADFVHVHSGANGWKDGVLAAAHLVCACRRKRELSACGTGKPVTEFVDEESHRKQIAEAGFRAPIKIVRTGRGRNHKWHIETHGKLQIARQCERMVSAQCDGIAISVGRRGQMLEQVSHIETGKGSSDILSIIQYFIFCKGDAGTHTHQQKTDKYYDSELFYM